MAAVEPVPAIELGVDAPGVPMCMLFIVEVPPMELAVDAAGVPVCTLLIIDVPPVVGLCATVPGVVGVICRRAFWKEMRK
jgi:hypothetical protein